MPGRAKGRDTSDFQFVQTVAELEQDDFDFFKATEGTGWTGLTFAGNWANAAAVKAGRPAYQRGAYHFLHPGADPIAQAQHFVSVVKANGLKPGDMLVCDSELPSGAAANLMSKGQRRNLPLTDADMQATPAAVDIATKAFCDEVVKLVGPHNPVIVYTMHEIGQLLTETAKAYPLLWFAWPSDTPPPADMYAPWKEWLFWQNSFSSSEAGGGDSDEFRKPVADLVAFIAKYLPKPRKRVVVPVVTNGSESLVTICAKHNNSIARVLWRTLGHDIQWALLKYLAGGNLAAVMPAGITLLVMETPGA